MRIFWLFIISLVSSSNTLQIQTLFSEGWESESFHSITGHIVVVSCYSQPTNSSATLAMDDQIIPLSFEQLTMKTLSNHVDILIQQQDAFIRTRLYAGVPVSFTLNSAGRFSFIIPVQELDTLLHIDTPEFLFRTDHMPVDQW